MKRLLAMLVGTAMLCALAACAGTGTSAGDGAASSGGSGVTVFGTIDAGVSSYKNQSR